MNGQPALFSISALFQSADFTWATALYILGGVGVTCLLVAGAMFMGLVLGTALACLQVYGPRWCGPLVGLYTWYFRGVPILVLLMLFHMGLISAVEAMAAHFFGYPLRVPAFVSAVIVLGLCSGAYQSQIFRGAMQSISAGQFKAAKALGMGNIGALNNVILPQAFRISIPAWSNEYSILLKDSAIAFTLGVIDIMSRFKAIAATNHKPLLMFILAGILYYVLTWAGVKLLMGLYERTRIPGLAGVDTSGNRDML